MKTRTKWSILTLVVALSGCAASGPTSTSVEHKGSITLVHHRQHVGNKSVDHLEAINAKGVVSSAVVEVYDIGRLPRPDGGMDEAHRYYRVAESPHWNLNLPTKSGTNGRGPKTVTTPPTYSPVPPDQRVADAVADAREAKEKLDKARDDIQKRLSEDNNLRGELEQAQSDNQALQDKLNAAFHTTGKPSPTPETDAQKAAQTSASDLQRWGASIGGTQQ
jgi:hypothetical protein